MIHAYAVTNGHLNRVPADQLERALWIDLHHPTDSERAAVRALGVEVPDSDQMGELQPSRRFRRGSAGLSMTVFLLGSGAGGVSRFGPVAFLVSTDRLVTVHDHTLDALESFPRLEEKLAEETRVPGGLMLALLEEIIGDIADRLEAVGAKFDLLADEVFGAQSLTPVELRETLQRSGQTGQRLSALHHGLLSVDRGLTFVEADGVEHFAAPDGTLSSLMRDVKALAYHCDYLSGRATALTDATLGLIDLAQNRSFSILSAVTALFVPPTFIASFYGMNFTNLPELHSPTGFAAVLGVMAFSVICAFLFLRWRRLL